MYMGTDNIRKPEIPKINLIKVNGPTSQLVSPHFDSLDSNTSLGFLDPYNAISYDRNSSFEPLIRFETTECQESHSCYSLSERSHDPDSRGIIDLSIFNNSKTLGITEQEIQLGDITKFKKFTFKPSNSYSEISNEDAETILKDFIQVRNITDYEKVDQLPSSTPIKEFYNAFLRCKW